MAKIGLLFPGQGSQVVGMGKDFFDHFPKSKEVFQEANESLGFDLANLCFEGPKEELQLTEHTQPAILTASIAALRALDTDLWISNTVCAGHSLGEYSAFVASGSLQLADAVRLVRKRGQFMQSAVPVGEGSMVAVLKATKEEVEHVCRITEGIVEAVNFNCPGQIVIAGSANAVQSAAIKLKELKARIIPLQVSAPFHSSLMKPAEEKLKPLLEEMAIHPSVCAVFRNVDAKPVSTSEEIRRGLIDQVSKPVLWEDTIVAMLRSGVELFVEIGPGKVLTSLVTRIDPQVQAIHLAQISDLDSAHTAIAQKLNNA